jgi:hypothetical protein
MKVALVQNSDGHDKKGVQAFIVSSGLKAGSDRPLLRAVLSRFESNRGVVAGLVPATSISRHSAAAMCDGAEPQQ